MSLTTGAHLRTASSPCEVVVVRAPSAAGSVLCAGQAMTSDASLDMSSATDGPMVALGKRYTHEASGLELLCVKPGPGPLTFAGEQLVLKSAKPLPASD